MQVDAVSVNHLHYASIFCRERDSFRHEYAFLFHTVYGGIPAVHVATTMAKVNQPLLCLQGNETAFKSAN